MPTPSDGEAEDLGRQVAPHRKAYVAPTNYEALGPKPSDYPTESWVAGHEGDVGYTLYVGEDGKPKACEVTESSGFELLDMQACKLLMERSKFEPAIDADGNRVSGEFSSRYRWAKREPEFPGTLTVHVAYTVNEDGTLTDCETIEISGSISERMQRQIEREPCPGING
ncbi:MAG: TonB family protein, partial [Pseudomonadota bacterium]